MPEPKSDETEQEFTARFMGDPDMMQEYPDAAQRMAMCKKQWQKSREIMPADNTLATGLANEYSVGADGWVRIAPYGDHVKERTIRDTIGTRQETLLQRLDRASAQAMVDKFHSFLGRIKRFIVGVPIFRRHPDLAEHAPDTVAAMSNDTNTYGMFAALEAREDGFYGRPVVSKDGQAAIEHEGLKYLSPFWWVKRIGENNGVPIVSPTELISAGLTNSPNIPGGEALANAKDKIMNQTTLIALLAKFGIALANEATDDQISAEITKLGQKAQAAAALENEKTTTVTEINKLKDQVNSKETEISAGKVALMNERNARIELLVDAAIRGARILAGDRQSRINALKSDFEGGKTALENEKPKMNTHSQVGALGARLGEGQRSTTALSAITALANERRGKNGGDWDEAWAYALEQKPELAEQLHKPGVK